MCGNVGIINRETYKLDSERLIKYFSQALFTDTLRGKHGTGIAAVDTNGDISVHKKAMAAPDFLDLARTQNIITDHSNVFLAGHNRWATQGSHTDENTHPFNHSHITMFHNGTLTSVTDLPDGNKFTVDSNAIAHALSIQSVKKTLENLDGAFALVWYDSERESINFARNKERPLWFGKLEGSSSFIYASEKEMLTWLSSRNSIKLDNMYELPIGQHIEVPLDPESDVILNKFTPKKPCLYEDYGYGYGYAKSNGSNTTYKTAKSTSLVGKVFSCFVKSWTKYPNSETMGVMKVNLMDKGSCIECCIASTTKSLGEELTNTTIDVKVTSNTTASTYGTYVPKLTVVEDIVKQAKRELAVVEEKEEFQEQAALTEEQHNTIVDNFSDSGSTLTRIGPNCDMISQAKYNSLTKHGCSNCSADLSDEDDCDITWDVMDNPFCPDCAKTELYV